MKNIKVGILDYGFGNLSSLYSCLMALGFSVNISDKKSILKKSDILFLPGVGAFDAGMKAIKAKSLDDFIKEFYTTGKPLIGICLGMQLFFSSSKEGSKTKGLGLLPGNITKIDSNSSHIGWNKIDLTKSSSIFNKFNKKSFYFNHLYSYQGSSRIVSAQSEINKDNLIASIVKKKNLIGLQFHPEKSQENGAALLKAIILKGHNA